MHKQALLLFCDPISQVRTLCACVPVLILHVNTSPGASVIPCHKYVLFILVFWYYDNVNTQSFVWKVLWPYKKFHSFINVRCIAHLRTPAVPVRIRLLTFSWHLTQLCWSVRLHWLWLPGQRIYPRWRRSAFCFIHLYHSCRISRHKLTLLTHPLPPVCQ